MDLLSTALVLAPIVLLAYTTEAFTGFGASVIAVTLGAHFYPIDKLVPVIVALNVVVAAYITARHHRHAKKKLLLTRVLPFMSLGLVIGVLLFPLVDREVLKWLLGMFVLVFAVRQLWLLRPSAGSDRPISSLRAGLFQVIAGVAHSFFSTGGPPLVYSLSRMELPKHVFRATLSIVWLVFSVTLVAIFTVNGRLNTEGWRLVLLLFPTMPLGILIGEWLHGRVDEKGFRVFIYVLLLVSGVVLFL